MVIEMYSFEDGFRFVDKYEFSDQKTLEQALFLRRLSGKLVGYKIYEISMANFNELSLTERNKLPNVQWFDKGAYINEQGKKQ